MCGIVGIWDYTQAEDLCAGDSLSQALTAMEHRGPDGQGVYTGPGVSLGHVRLSIIDLSERGGQPMRSGHFVIVYNGEVYNYKELRQELTGQGAVFCSESDTEVVLQAYARWGKDCVRRFRGMFAFAIWDQKRDELFLARDRCGERPLLYAVCDNRFIFASEMKTLRKLLPERPALDPAVVNMFLHYQYVPEPWTLLQGVCKLPAGHTMTLTRAGKLVPEAYWDVMGAGVTTEETAASYHDVPSMLDAIRDTLEESIKLCLRADVPVGVALSGGIDSGVIAALAQKNSAEPLHAFSVGYPGRPAYDEREQAKRLAHNLGMIFHEVEIPVNDFVTEFPSLVTILDEPMADIAAFGHLAVSKAAHALGMKVLLTGIGGDELFWGYDWTRQAVALNMEMARKPFSPWMLALFRQSSLRPLPRSLARKSWLPKSVRRRAGLFFSALEANPAEYPYFMTLSHDFCEARKTVLAVAGAALRALPCNTVFWPQAMPSPTLTGISSGNSFDNAPDSPALVMGLLFRTWLTSNCLMLGDRVSMSMSVESRLPFLDAELMGLVMALRRQSPDHELGQKAWLRAALKGVLPDEVLARPKAGFTPPVKEWVGGVVQAYGQCLLDGELCRAGLVERQAIAQWLSNPQSLKRQQIFLLYKLIMLEMWYTHCMA